MLIGASKNGEIINILKKVPMKGGDNGSRFFKYPVRSYGEHNKKMLYVYQFTWKCFNGMIPEK